MKVLDLKLTGLKLILPKIMEDERGFFFESFRASTLKHAGIDTVFVQDNVSYSTKGTVRALHFQSDPGQDKLISCVQGEIWDVAVDLRPSSKTYLKYEAVILSEKNHKQLFIPKGFAHGFCVISPEARVHYKVSSYYNPETEKSIRWNDPDLNINWPVKEPVLSKRDRESSFLKEIKQHVALDNG